ncbi:acid phosphatase [Amycolatopsis xylanica]|uniref:Acid phosphatase n=1 Tax=Amycolatopsis xylanica TaxID=589385 RepID=A0A1H3RJU4_9PSEU|nr:alkaline phosphatase family protein [Amycolatopsis xylanica]SDZ25936.1 acid phosphatase [Amycolatopsis xylanica]
MFLKRITAAAVAATAVAAAVTAVSHQSATAASGVPAFDHIVLVMFENKDFKEINNSSKAPYFNKLASQGAKFTKAFGTTHPSQPNYISLFAGSTLGVSSNSCKDLGNKENLATQLASVKKSFVGYAESMPSDGYTGCESGELYARKHNSWVSFSNVPKSSNKRFSAFPSDFSKLPTVSFVTPDLCSDMHDCGIDTGDKWLKKHLDAYAQWAKTHNSLLIVTFDEDNGSSVNQIFTAFVGAHVKPGSYSTSINHYSVLRTIEAAYGLPGLNEAAKKSPISGVWN